MADLDDEELRATRKLSGGDICEGDYVRTDEGYIVKIDEDEEWFKNRLIQGGSLFGKALKHSPNIIELIEVGDYVNGEKVIEVDSFKDWIDIGDEVIREEDIKNIVTPEQFNSIMYRVKE